MGEESTMKEQTASHTYKRQAPLGLFPVNAPEAPGAEKRKGEREHQAALEKASQPRRRVVTIPQADPSSAWNTFSERRGQRQREREKPQQYTAVVQRRTA